jgi:hypothetical protein
MMITVIALVSRSQMNDFKSRLGGIAMAQGEIAILDVRGTGGVYKALPSLQKADKPDSDRRYAERGLRGLELACSRAREKNPSSPSAVVLGDALSFYKQVIPGYSDFDDSGGSARGAGLSVLSPERCREILGWWGIIDLPDLEKAVEEHLSAFKEVGPAYTFQSALDFIEYIRVYVRLLGQAAAEDRFYVSFFA